MKRSLNKKLSHQLNLNTVLNVAIVTSGSSLLFCAARYLYLTRAQHRADALAATFDSKMLLVTVVSTCIAVLVAVVDKQATTRQLRVALLLGLLIVLPGIVWALWDWWFALHWL